MNYSFRDFARHLELWRDARNLTEVRPFPEKPSEVVDIRSAPYDEALNLRIMHMFTSEGCSRDDLRYRSKRFFVMYQFLNAREDDLRSAGFFMLDDGTQQTIPMKLIRAIHETFCGELLRDYKSVSVDSVVTLANSYPPEWKPSECA